MLFFCPGCRSPMARARAAGAGYWGCNPCGGRAVTLAALRKALAPAAFEAVREAAAHPGDPGFRRCHLCGGTLRHVHVRTDGKPVELDACQPCAVLWFDRGEMEAAGPAAPLPPTPPVPETPGPAPVVIFDRDRPPPEPVEVARFSFAGNWSDIPAVLGLPVEEDGDVWHRPWATWGLALGILVVSVAAMLTGLPSWIRDWGFVPSDPFRHGGLDSVTSFFLHAGFWHLLGNLYFLLVFGDNVEDLLRPGRYLLLILLSTFAGDFLYALFAWGSDSPSVGASGGISGLLAYFALALPHARVRTTHFIHYAVEPVSLRWSSRGAFGAWVALQVLGAVFQVMDMGGGVNALAHLGGAAAGAGLWWAWRFRPESAAPRTSRSST